MVECPTSVMMLQRVDSEDRANAKQLTSEVIQQADELLQPQPVQSEESSLDSCSGSPQRAEPPGQFLSAFSSPDDSQTFFSRVTSASSSGYSPQQSPLQSALHFSPVSTPSRGEHLLPITPGSYSTDTSSLRSSTLPTTPNRPVSGAQQPLPLSNRTFLSVSTSSDSSVAASPNTSKAGASPNVSPRSRFERLAEAKAKRRAERRQLPAATLQPKVSAAAPPVVVEKKEQHQQQDGQSEQDDHAHLQKEIQEQFAQEFENEKQEQREHLELQEHIQEQFDQEQEKQEHTAQQDEQELDQVPNMDLDESYHEEPEKPDNIPVSSEKQPVNSEKQQVQQEEFHKEKSREHAQLPPHPNRAAPPRPPSVDPLESLNTEKRKTRRAKRSKDKNTSGSDVDSDWSSDAIESVSSSVNLALDKLKAMAKPYLGQSADNDDTAPEVVNTSTEETTEGAQDADTASSSSGPDCSGLDLKELERELRAKKPDETAEQRETVEETNTGETEPPRRHVSRNASNSSYDTLGMPKPAILAHDPSLLWNLQKPVPRAGAPPLAVTRGGHSAKEVVGLQLAHGDKLNHSSKGSEVGSNLSGSNGSSTSSMRASRAVTPIMRMRGTGGERDAATTERAVPAMAATVGKRKSMKDSIEEDCNEEDHIALQQKRWKEKMKLVERQREKEKKLLAGEAAHRRRKKRSKSRRRRTQRDDASSSTRSQRPFAAAFPACQNELTSMLEKFVRVRCGNLEDAFFEDDDEDSDDSTQGSEYETEDDGTDASADFTDNTDLDDSLSRARTSVDAGTMTSAVSEANRTVGTMTSATKTAYSIGVNASTATSASIIPVTPTKEKLNRKSALGIKDKNFIRAFISGATKDGFVLMLHEKNCKKSLNGPIKTTVFVKRGAPGADGRFVGPSLIWKATDGSEIGEVDIFDIRSLDKATALQLEDYPLAMPGRSLFLRMNKGGDYVFEAENQDDALRFVHGMRWVVARLSFNLIIGNLGVSCELLDVERSGNEEHGKFPRTLKEEAHWTMAMTDVTSHLVDKAAIL